MIPTGNLALGSAIQPYKIICPSPWTLMGVCCMGTILVGACCSLMSLSPSLPGGVGGEISPLRMCRSVSAAGVRNMDDAPLMMNAARWWCFVRLAPLPLPSAPPHSYYSFADITLPCDKLIHKLQSFVLCCLGH
jgi:hypothetical protein